MSAQPPQDPYTAQLPLVLGRGKGGSVKKQLKRIVLSFWRLLYQVFVPYNPRPEPPEDPPTPSSALADETMEQCKKIYEDAETSRKYLEDKARATFTMTSFLAPLLVSVFVFLLSKAKASPATTLAIYIAMTAGIFLLFGFISIVRAVSVQVRETLQLRSVLDMSTKDFRPYDRGFHAGGLLYCASVNTAMNGHIAQFVKGAQVMTALAVLLACAAALPLAYTLSKSQDQTPHAVVDGTVKIESASLDGISTKLEQLSMELHASQGRADPSAELAKLQIEIDQLKVRLQRSGALRSSCPSGAMPGCDSACSPQSAACRPPN